MAAPLPLVESFLLATRIQNSCSTCYTVNFCDYIFVITVLSSLNVTCSGGKWGSLWDSPFLVRLTWLEKDSFYEFHPSVEDCYILIRTLKQMKLREKKKRFCLSPVPSICCCDHLLTWQTPAKTWQDFHDILIACITQAFDGCRKIHISQSSMNTKMWMILQPSSENCHPLVSCISSGSSQKSFLLWIFIQNTEETARKRTRTH